MSEYTYIGDHLTADEFRGKCNAVKKENGKCIRGRNGNMLVEFAGRKVVVIARRLRKENKRHYNNFK